MFCVVSPIFLPQAVNVGNPGKEIIVASIGVFKQNRVMVHFANISLIGMPGTGKSTVGVLLAKALSWSFLDTDVLIQVAEERQVREIVYQEGIEEFGQIEQRHVLALNRRNYVIATGGGVVCGPAAMEHLKSLGAVIHLDMALPSVEKRLRRMNGWGIVMAPGQSLTGIFQQRQPLYQQYADFVIDCNDRTHEEIVEQILGRLG